MRNTAKTQQTQAHKSSVRQESKCRLTLKGQIGIPERLKESLDFPYWSTAISDKYFENTSVCTRLACRDHGVSPVLQWRLFGFHGNFFLLHSTMLNSVRRRPGTIVIAFVHGANVSKQKNVWTVFGSRSKKFRQRFDRKR